MNELAHLTATEALAGLRAGTFSAEELVRACLARIDERDSTVRAWVQVEREGAIAQARECDKSAVKGALHGLPIAVKDVFLTADMPTQYNSPIYTGFSPKIDAAAVSLLRQAGAIVLGKTETVEFGANGRKALTRNPHDLSRTPGGSSSGSAAAVADFHVPLALGTQTGGSMIRPASFCGVYAMKPTWNLVSNEGARKYATTLDTVGWFARSPSDLTVLHQVLVADDSTCASLDLTQARLGFLRTPFWERADQSTRDAFDLAMRVTRKAGASVVELTSPEDFAGLADAQMRIMRNEGRAAFLAEYRRDAQRLDQSIREQVENRDETTYAQLLSAYDLAASCRPAFDALASEFDAIVAPSTVGEALPGLANTGDLIFCGLWTLLHVPCINLAGLTGVSGLPVGLTLTGPRFSDRRLLRAAEALAPALSCATQKLNAA